jgi:hypothetical protein
MTTLAVLRRLVRQQTETTEAELPNVTVDDFLTQAFERTVNAEVQWPYYETSWALLQLAGTTSIPVPADAWPPGFMSFLDVEENIRLVQIDPEEAEDRYFGTTRNSHRAINYSVWNDVIQIWPKHIHEEDRSYTLRGFRLPKRFPVVIDGVTDSEQEPDLDPRLHNCLAHYATALAYIQQEDMELENQYMKRWQNDVELARNVIMEPAHYRPLMMGPSVLYTTPIGPGFRGGAGRSSGPSAFNVAIPGADGTDGTDAFAYFVYSKSVDHLAIGEVYEQIATLNATLPINGTYMIGAALTWTLTSTASSAQWRWRINGGDWNENIRQPKDASEKYSDYYAYPDEYTAGALFIEVEAQKTANPGVFDVQFLDIFAEYKANT